MRPTPLPAGPGQTSVWSFPRPAVAEPAAAPLRVEFGGETVASTSAGVRTLETSHPPCVLRQLCCNFYRAAMSFNVDASSRKSTH